MAEDTVPVVRRRHGKDDAECTNRPKTHPAVLALARLIGRQMAREHFEALAAANDNSAPRHTGAAPPGNAMSGAPDTS